MKKQFKLEYKWVIAGLCFLMIFTCLGFCSSNKSLYITAITDALGVKRSAFALSDSIRFISTSIFNIFFGSMVAKFGTKKLIGAGFVCLISAMLIYSFAPSIYFFYIGGFLLGMGFSWTSTTMVGCVVNKWCKENRGTVMGAVLAANGFGGALAAQIVAPIIYEEGNPFGYRNAYRLVALIVFCVGVIVMLFFRENPKGQEGTATVVHKKKARGQGWVGIDYNEAKTMWYFYAGAIFIFLTGMVLQGITGVAAAHMRDIGLDAGFVASALSVHSLALAFFKFATGIIYDHKGLRFTVNICAITGVVVMLMLAFITPSPLGKVLAVLYSIFSSLALPLETIMLPIYANDLFGEKSFNKILGIFVSVNTAGYAVGSPLVNLGYDINGTYTPILIVMTVVMIITVIGLQFVITAANKQREIVLKKAAEEEAKAEQPVK
nr:MFS transporter [Clostridia bacterium]